MAFIVYLINHVIMNHAHLYKRLKELLVRHAETFPLIISSAH